MPPEKIVALGISQVPEGRLIFPQLTVTENLFLNPGALGRRAWQAERPSHERKRAVDVVN